MKNMMSLPTPFHGNHPAYNKYVEGLLWEMREQGPLTLEKLAELQKQLRSEVQAIKDSGGFSKLNDAFRK